VQCFFPRIHENEIIPEKSGIITWAVQLQIKGFEQQPFAWLHFRVPGAIEVGIRSQEQ
jgi:hypothetical protein